jgi:hypothetical protein
MSQDYNYLRNTVGEVVVMFLTAVNESVTAGNGIFQQMTNSELWQLLATILSGVVVYVLSQLYTEFVLRPIQEYKVLKAKVAKHLVLYACYYSNPQAIGSSADFPAWKNAGDVTRELASEVAAFAEIKPLKIFTLFSIPTKTKLTERATHLIGLSNSYFEDPSCVHMTVKNTKETVRIIKKSLGISKR